MFGCQMDSKAICQFIGGRGLLLLFLIELEYCENSRSATCAREQCSVRHPVLAVSTLDGDPAPDSQLIIQPGRIFRSLSPQRGVHCPQVAASLIANQGPLGGRWAQALGGHIMTAVTDPQIARDRHNNVSIGAQNGNVAPNMDIVLHSGVRFVEFLQIWTL